MPIFPTMYVYLHIHINLYLHFPISYLCQSILLTIFFYLPAYGYVTLLVSHMSPYLGISLTYLPTHSFLFFTLPYCHLNNYSVPIRWSWTAWIRPVVFVVSCECAIQCDQMARFFFNIWQLTTTKFAQLHKHFPKLVTKNPILYNPYKNCPRLLKYCQSGKSGFTGAIIFSPRSKF